MPTQTDKTFTDGEIEGVIVRPLVKYHDKRGWLTELFRHDQLEAKFYPVMTYASMTEPGVTRGPHEHVDQADLFSFFGPSVFEMRLWDNRPHSPTYGHRMILTTGQENPLSILVPLGVVHAYRNIGDTGGLVVNSPNQLFRGEGGREPIDEIRHEDDPDTIYQFDK